MNKPPYIIYIPFQDFPDGISRYELLGLLYKLDKNFDAIKICQITDGVELEKQEIRVDVIEDKVKFSKIKKIIEEKCKIIEDKSTSLKAPDNKNVKHKPTKEVAKIEVVGLKEGLEAISRNNNKPDDKNKFPHKLPAGTKWEDFIFKFEDDENIFIQVKRLKHTANYKDFKLIGRGKNPLPGEPWNFLKTLAKLNGEITIKDSDAKTKYKKQKELLSKALKDYFALDYDPFYPYHSSSEKDGNSYKIKITLLPKEGEPPVSVEKIKSKNNEDEDDKLGIKEYLKDFNG